MGTFTDVVPGEGKTLAELDAIALRGEPFASFGFGYDCPRGGKLADDYEVVIIARRGMGNCGLAVLRGLTPRGRSFVRAGKVRRLVSRGVRREVAEVAVGRPHGMEEGVAELAGELLDAVAWRLTSIKRLEAVHARWSLDRLMRDADIPDDVAAGLSMPRCWAAIGIAVEVATAMGLREEPAHASS